MVRESFKGNGRKRICSTQNGESKFVKKIALQWNASDQFKGEEVYQYQSFVMVMLCSFLCFSNQQFNGGAREIPQRSLYAQSLYSNKVNAVHLVYSMVLRIFARALMRKRIGLSYKSRVELKYT